MSRSSTYNRGSRRQHRQQHRGQPVDSKESFVQLKCDPDVIEARCWQCMSSTADRLLLLQENYIKLKRDSEANEVLLLAVREQLGVREGELAQCQQELAEQKGRCGSMELSMNTEVASRERTERELKTAYLQRDAIQGQLDRLAVATSCSHFRLQPEVAAAVHYHCAALSDWAVSSRVLLIWGLKRSFCQVLPSMTWLSVQLGS